MRKLIFCGMLVLAGSFALPACSGTHRIVRIRDFYRLPTPPNPVATTGRVVSNSPCIEIAERGIPGYVYGRTETVYVTGVGINAVLGEFIVIRGNAREIDVNGVTKILIEATEKEPSINDDIQIPSGTFWMGNSEQGADNGYLWSRERPKHQVYFKAPLNISRFEVTRGDYKRFIEANGYTNPLYWSQAGWTWRTQPSSIIQPLGWDELWTHNNMFLQTDSHPVVGVSYWEAQAYCTWAGARLPTEAEWEYAARYDPATGSKCYPWGDIWNAEMCNNWNDTNPATFGMSSTAPVGSYPGNQSPSGCYDMAGNVSEWVSDWYSDSYYQTGGPWADPTGPGSGTLKVVKGGNWSDLVCADGTRCAARKAVSPNTQQYYIGFRVVK